MPQHTIHRYHYVSRLDGMVQLISNNCLDALGGKSLDDFFRIILSLLQVRLPPLAPPPGAHNNHLGFYAPNTIKPFANFNSSLHFFLDGMPFEVVNRRQGEDMAVNVLYYCRGMKLLRTCSGLE